VTNSANGSWAGDRLLSEVTGSYQDGRGLPPESYFDEDVYQLEIDNIFTKEWLCVGRADQIPNAGDYFTITLVGEPLVVVRGEDGTVRVMSSVCQHRAMVITGPCDGEKDEWLDEPQESSGNCGRGFRCPYHFWTYAADGSLIGAPEMNRTPGFRKEDIKLPTLRTEIWQGFIFVNFDPAAPALGPRISPIDPLIANWRLSEMATEKPTSLRNLPWNWKIMHENSIDVYHVDRLHHPRHAVLPGKGYLPLTIDTNDAAIIFAHIATHQDFALSPIGQPLFPVIGSLTQEERGRSYIFLIPPTLLIILNSDSAFYRIVHPRSAKTIEIRQTLMVPAAYRELPNYADLVQLGSTMHLHLNYQDYMVDAAVQRAQRSRFAPRGPYAWNENAVAEFDNWVARRYVRPSGAVVPDAAVGSAAGSAAGSGT
jgi:phenylpropionate dioxygenase-like ring-hydroxylating dioxygenase large terminal subunit